MEDFSKIILKGAGISFLGLLISKFFMFFYRLVIARGLSIGDYGVFSLAFAISSIIVTFSMFGLPSAIQRFVPHYREKSHDIVRGIVILAVVISLLISGVFLVSAFFSIDLITAIFNNAELNPILLIFLLAIPFILIATLFSSLAVAFKKVIYQVISINIVYPALNLLFAASAVYFGFGLFGVSWAYVISYFIAAVVVVILVEKNIFAVLFSKIKPKFMFSEILSFSWPLLAASIFGMILMWTDTLILGVLKTEDVVGLYNAAIPIANILMLVPPAILAVFLPIVSELMTKGQHEEIKQSYSQVLRWIYLINIPVFTLIAFFPRQILGFLFGPEYVGASTALILLSIGIFANSIGYPAYKMFELHKKTKQFFYNNIITAIINLLLNIILVPMFGIEGAAIASTTALLISIIIFTVQLRRIAALPIINMDMIKTFVLSISTVGVIYFIAKMILGYITFFWMIPLLVVYGIAYLAITYFFNLITKEDIAILTSVLAKIGIKK